MVNLWPSFISPKQRETITQLIRFCIVGFSGMFIDMGTTVLTTELLGFDPRLGAVCGFVLAVINNYFLNRFWTFKGKVKTSQKFAFVSFILISLIGMTISIGVMHLSITYLGLNKATPAEIAAASGFVVYWLKYRYLLARFMGIVVATLWNFTGSKKIAFKS